MSEAVPMAMKTAEAVRMTLNLDVSLLDFTSSQGELVGCCRGSMCGRYRGVGMTMTQAWGVA